MFIYIYNIAFLFKDDLSSKHYWRIFLVFTFGLGVYFVIILATWRYELVSVEHNFQNEKGLIHPNLIFLRVSHFHDRVTSWSSFAVVYIFFVTCLRLSWSLLLWCGWRYGTRVACGVFIGTSTFSASSDLLVENNSIECVFVSWSST